MFQNKIISFIVPLLVTCSLVGVGFSSWYFDHENLNTDTKNISVYTMSDVTKGTLELISSPSQIVFSQGNGEVNNTKDGISFYTKVNNYYEENDEVKVKYTPVDNRDSLEASEFKLYISFGETSFNDVVKLSDYYSSATSENGGYDFKDDIVDETSTNGYYVYTLNLSDVIEYKSAGTNGVKPITEEKYNALVNSLSDANVTINIVSI